MQNNSTGGPEAELADLYREVIVDHYHRPRHFGPLPAANIRAQGMNPLCGDDVEVELIVNANAIAAAGFTGRGCAISRASASLMTDEVIGLTIDETMHLVGAFEAMLKEGGEPDPILGELEALRGVARFPVRIKCALLPWKVLRDALDDYAEANA